MDAYQAKFTTMQHFVPFLDKTIRKLERAGDKTKEAQLGKMKSLHGILTDPQKKVRLEVLVKCEDVLKMLYEKVEGHPWPQVEVRREQRALSTPRSPSPEQGGWRGPGPGPQQHRGPPQGPRRGSSLLGEGPRAFQGTSQRGGPDPWGGRGPPANNQGPWREGQGPKGGYVPPLHRDGSGSMWEGPGPMRDGSGTMRDGLGTMRDGSGPMRDGSGPMRDGPMWEGPGPLRDGPGVMRDGQGPGWDGAGPMRDRSGSMQDASGPWHGPPGRGPLFDGQWQGPPGPWQDGHGPARGGHRGMPEGRQRGGFGRQDNYRANRRGPPPNFQESRHFQADYPEYPPDHPPQGRRQGGYPGDTGGGGRGSNPRGGGAWQQAPHERGMGRVPGSQREYDQEEHHGSWGPEEKRGRWDRSMSPGEGPRDRWGRSSTPPIGQPVTPRSPEPDTPLSPVQDTPLSPELKSPPWSRSKALPAVTAPKSIPLERPVEKPKLSEAERKNKLLSLMGGKSAREFSPSLFAPKPSQASPQSPQEPDSQRSDPVPIPMKTSPKSARPPWSSPTDSPPGLSIAESPMSPDTQTASPEQMPSPDTQTVTPPLSATSPSSPFPDTPASPDLDDPASPDPDQLILDTPSSPETATSPSHSTKEIPTMPRADSTRTEPEPPPQPRTSASPTPSAPQTSQPSRRDPRNRKKEPVKTTTQSPYAPLPVAPPKPQGPLASLGSLGLEPPAYMSNVLGQQQPPPLVPPVPHSPIQRSPAQPPAPPLPSYVPPQPQLNNQPPNPPMPQRPPMRPQVMGHPARTTQMMNNTPRSFREYRHMKEEAEKQRKEYENNVRKQHEEKLRKEREEQEGRLKLENAKAEIKEEPPVFTIDDFDDTMSAKELRDKRKEKLQKLAESKDPRKRKLLHEKQKIKEKTEVKSSEVIKGFKIPKVKKISAAEGKTGKPDKLAVIDIFKPLEIGNTPKANLTQIKKKRKIEKFITKPLKEDPSSESEIPTEASEEARESTKSAIIKPPNVVDPPPQLPPTSSEDVIKEEIDDKPSTSTTSLPCLPTTTPATPPYHDSDSDSEPGLTIAEEGERRISRSSESETESHKAARLEDASASETSTEEHSKTSNDAATLETSTEEHSKTSKDSATLETSTEEHSITSKNAVAPETSTEEHSITSKEENVDVYEKSLTDNIADVGPSKKLDAKDDKSLSKEELTKELLKNIVSTLDPLKAKKLLEKASNMENVDKISLTDLKGLLTHVSSDSEEEEIPLSVLSKKRSRAQPRTQEKKAVKVKKSQKKTSPPSEPSSSGTRRSKRRGAREEVNYDEEENENVPANVPNKSVVEPVQEISEEVEEEEEEETFIIEPKEKKKKRGRKKKSKAPEIQFELDDEDLQDAFISSSGFIEQMQESKEAKEEEKAVKLEVLENVDEKYDGELEVPVKLEEEIEGVKLEPGSVREERMSVDALSPPPAASMRQTRSMRSRMAPKSKTWFPGDRGGSENKKSTFVESLKSPTIKVELKQEEVPVDAKVFLGEGEVASDSFVSDAFEVKPATLEPRQIEGLKESRSKLTSIFDKFTKHSQQSVLNERQVLVEAHIEKSNKKEETLCSKIKLRRPPRTVKPLEDLPTGKPTVLPSLISRLSSLVVKTEEEDNGAQEVGETNISLLGLLQNMKKLQQRRPPPDLIPLTAQPPPLLTLLPEEQNHLAPATACLTRAQLAQQKSSDALEQLLLPSSLKHLFKCLLSPDCAFTSDSAHEFLQHAHINHPVGPPPQCGYCGGRVRDMTRLVNHTLKKHGHANLQCSHCFHRAGDRLGLMLHQLLHHPSLPRGFLPCRSLTSGSSPTLPTHTQHLVQCPVQGCPHEFPPSGLHLLPTHLSTHPLPHPTRVQDCSCLYCDFTSMSPVKVLLHLSLRHPQQQPKLRLRSIDLEKQAEEEDSSSNEEEEEDLDTSDAESDLSDFDKHFYDEDIDTIDDLVKPLGDDDVGLSEHLLYRCGSIGCTETASTANGLREHLAFCAHKTDDVDYTCYHCHSEHKHIPGLLEHIKTHAVKRLTCSLCPFRTSLMATLKQHGRTEHKLTQLTFMPLNPVKKNLEEDHFVMVPKNTLPKGPRSRHAKDTFSPLDVDKIPLRPEIYKYLIRCSICDFATKVRFNLVKHLRMHIRKDKMLAIGALREAVLPTLTPVNPPPILEREEETNYKSLLPEDIDEELYRLPITDEDMTHMPVFIVENHRYPCPQCAYITIDEVMLLDHINALHPKMKTFACPHCPGLKVDFESVGLHLRCHSELLFKCGYCLYFHWQKRIAEAHVGSTHPERKLFVKDVRANKEATERREAEKAEKEAAQKVEKDVTVIKANMLVYDPFKCGLCDSAFETLDGIRLHCEEQHGQTKQYKCSLCTFASNAKLDIDEHAKSMHPSGAPAILKVFFIDPSKGSGEEEKRHPLWSREMEGVKHIRGILYDEEGEDLKKKVAKPTVKREKKEKKEEVIWKTDEMDTMDNTINSVIAMKSTIDSSARDSAAITKTEVDYYPMKCKECGFSKKTVTGLKMHIKLNHLQVGKMQCKHCIFTANLKVSIHGHYRNKHPETIVQEDGEDKFDYIERSSEAQAFSQDYWKTEWGIPFLEERKATLEKERGLAKSWGEGGEVIIDKKKKGKPGPKKGSKRRPKAASDEPPAKELKMMDANSSLDLTDTIESELAPSKPLNALHEDQSPFEGRPSYMCGLCPKRSQQLDKIRQHSRQEHGVEGDGWRELSRDQVVSSMISAQYQHQPGGAPADYKCFYCHQTGGVHTLSQHTSLSHPGQVFRVVRFQAQRVSGYLECQLCGHLSTGFEKHLQKTHFHEEHPLEAEVKCSKYISKTKAVGTEAFASSQQAFKFDVNEAVGMVFSCPRLGLEEGACSYTTQTLSQMNAHLRKHTKTYKCGWCGKTFLDSAKFHQHSAMSHGEKIPDLVKDPEVNVNIMGSFEFSFVQAEAEYEALKGLLEYRILEDISKCGSKPEVGGSRMVARKSTCPEAKTRPGDRIRNVSRKSTGPGAKYWPETRIDTPYSFYRAQPEPFDPKLVKTRMAMGGIEITLDAEKMMGFMNLAPKLSLADCGAMEEQSESQVEEPPTEPLQDSFPEEEEGELIDDLLGGDDDDV